MIDDACVAIALILRVRVIERLYMYPFLIESLKVASMRNKYELAYWSSFEHA